MIKLLKTKKHDSVDPIMASDNNANAHCVWQSNGLFCYSKFNGVDWEYLNDCKIIDSIPSNTAVPKNGVCPDSDGNPYVLWAKSNYRNIFGQLSCLYLTYWNNYAWEKVGEKIILDVLYGASLVFFGDDLYVGSLIFRDNKYLLAITKYRDGTLTQLNSCEISALSKESNVLLRRVGDYIYCFWGCDGDGKHWIEHVVYDVGLNELRSTATKKIGFSDDSVPISGFDFVSL